MKKCNLCGENKATWSKNFPCHPSETPIWTDHLPEQPELSAVARGFSPGDIIRNSYGHIAICTYANHTWGDIRVRLRNKHASEFSSVAMGWRVVKKTSRAKAQRLLEEELHTNTKLYGFNHYFGIFPKTNETIFTTKIEFHYLINNMVWTY